MQSIYARTDVRPGQSLSPCVALAALVGCAVVCRRVGFAVALIGSRRYTLLSLLSSAAPSPAVASASPSLSSALAVALAALVGCAVACCRFGFAVALIGSDSSLLIHVLLSSAAPSFAVAWASPSLSSALAVALADSSPAPSPAVASASPSLSSHRSSALAVDHIASVGCAVACCRFGFAVALIGSRRCLYCSRRLRRRRLLSLQFRRRSHRLWTLY